MKNGYVEAGKSHTGYIPPPSGEQGHQQGRVKRYARPKQARPTGGTFLASPTSPALIGLTGSAKPVKHVDSRTPGRVAGA